MSSECTKPLDVVMKDPKEPSPIDISKEQMIDRRITQGRDGKKLEGLNFTPFMSESDSLLYNEIDSCLRGECGDGLQEVVQDFMMDGIFE